MCSSCSLLTQYHFSLIKYMIARVLYKANWIAERCHNGHKLPSALKTSDSHRKIPFCWAVCHFLQHFAKCIEHLTTGTLHAATIVLFIISPNFFSFFSSFFLPCFTFYSFLQEYISLQKHKFLSIFFSSNEI